MMWLAMSAGAGGVPAASEVGLRESVDVGRGGAGCGG